MMIPWKGEAESDDFTLIASSTIAEPLGEMQVTSAYISLQMPHEASSTSLHYDAIAINGLSQV